MGKHWAMRMWEWRWVRVCVCGWECARMCVCGGGPKADGAEDIVHAVACSGGCCIDGACCDQKARRESGRTVVVAGSTPLPSRCTRWGLAFSDAGMVVTRSFALKPSSPGLQSGRMHVRGCVRGTCVRAGRVFARLACARVRALQSATSQSLGCS